MSDIPNTEYITINKYGIFVGGKSATTYHGENIGFIHDIKEHFAAIQKRNPVVQELHAGAFEVNGEYAKPGTPSGKPGLYAWCRAKLFDGRLGPWVFCGTFGTADICAHYCADYCGSYVHRIFDFRSAVLSFVTKDKTNTKQYERICTFKFGNYILTFEKIIQKTK